MQKWFAKVLCLVTSIFGFKSVQAEEKTSMATENPVLVFETTQGSFEVTLFPTIAPKACENFCKLAENHYYDGTMFHRVIKAFMIQGGDPQGNGTGGQSIWGTSFADEFAPGITFNKPGLLAMANRGPNTNGSQFFITTVATPWLNQKHTIFGEVTSGYEVIKKLEMIQTDGRDRPVESQKITRVYLKTPAAVR